MKWFQIFILTTIQIQISVANQILYVLPNDSSNVSCTSQPCAILSQYLLDNGTLPVVSNVEYHFLPGEHHVPANMVLQNLHNFSIVGSKMEASYTVLFGCSQSYVVNIIDSVNVTIANVMFKQCYQSQYRTNLLINLCDSCTIENVTFINLGLIGKNLIGNSHLTKIMIKLDTTLAQLELLVHCQGIALLYGNDHKSHLTTLNQININSNQCYNNPKGIYIYINSYYYTVTIIINNSLFYNLDHTVLSINSINSGNSVIIVENCTFGFNTIGYFNTVYYQITTNPLVEIVLPHDNKTISFKNCKFESNLSKQSLISIVVKASRYFYIKPICISPLTNISFVGCLFNSNQGELIKITGNLCKPNLFIIGPSYFADTLAGLNVFEIYNLIYVSSMVVYIHGPVNISMNHASSILFFKSCDVTFNKKITFTSNECDQLINLQFACIKIMEYSNITLIQTKYHNKIIETENDDEYKLYPLCIFQFVTLRNITVSPTHYSINIIDNLYTYNTYKFILDQHQEEIGTHPFYHFTPHCQWISAAAFHTYNPGGIYKQILKIDNETPSYHRICHCFQNGSNCNLDVFGPVHPGQTLQIQLCTPCDNKVFVLYAEVYSIFLPDSACKVATQNEKTNTISNYSKQVSFTIVSEATDVCELFLIASSYSYNINEAFYVELLPCPIGFTLQSGVCDCDLIFSSYIDKCYIDISAIQRPDNTWITAHTQANNTKYLISDCPMDYCLPYSSNVNLLHPDSQCQFNRTGILCSQCQHHLSMIFGSSRCLKCTNLHILITIIVIVAGIVLVVLLYLLNLTVTNGTINGIIFYANVVSINDSVFLINDNMFKPLRVFISFANLDLGIETCFYNGMDSYAKMWLQLFFPFYLTIIAVSIIIASRYSSRILRLTYTRSLPVLATLFLLSYTGVLRTVLTVLFSYSTITHLPSDHQQIVWSIDASVPLFGLKFTILFIMCLVLFLLLIPFNITLLFTRHFLQFRIISRFKPLLDAFQGSYKDRYYYWIAVHIILRSLFFTFYAFKTNLKLILSAIVLIFFSIYSGYIHPYKNKLVNIQEVLLLINLTIMYVVSYNCSDYLFSTITDAMISLAFVQFCIMVLYHFLTYTCHFNIVRIMQNIKQKVIKFCNKKHLKPASYNVALLNVPERMYNYAEYQDGLVSDDFA